MNLSREIFSKASSSLARGLHDIRKVPGFGSIQGLMR
jgi:hypothetical protein